MSTTESLGRATPRMTPCRQLASAVLMVRPAAFGYNEETALSNRMQRPGDPGAAGSAAAQARAEFDETVRQLEGAGVTVCVVEDTSVPVKPDAVFPNNWVSFHADGTVVLYPMQAKSRRLERRPEIIEEVCAQLGFKVTRTLDLTHHEQEGRFLEGTGSLVLDHTEHVAYACLSPRTHPAVVEEWAGLMGYKSVLFHATDLSGVPLYHTNVLMSIGEKVAVAGLTAIPQDDHGRVVPELMASGRVLLPITPEQIAGFAGNVLELRARDGAGVLVMSASARQALGSDAIAQLKKCTDRTVTVDLPTIERLGGGSARCMLAEVFVTP
jgi:hypothetical protein